VLFPTRRYLITALLAAGAAGGCNDATSPDSARAQLEANRAKWDRLSQPVYSFTLRQLCFCAFVQPVRVSVRNDTIVAANEISGGASIDPRYVQTVRSLFDFIDRAITNKAATLRVTYDPALGYPTEIVYDGSLMGADDEVTYTIKDVALTVLLKGKLQFASDGSRYGTAPAAPARRGSAPAVTLPLSIRTAAP
jgi:uncharacterized protein DUF6174